MTQAPLKSLKGLKKKRSRRQVHVNTESVIKTRFIDDAAQFPLVVEPTLENVNLQKWAAENRDFVETHLHKHGAVLFRGFSIDQIETFQSVAETLYPNLLDYVEKAAPRQKLASKTYNSTYFPSSEWIPLHHEMAYSHNWPEKLFFYCDIPATEQGYTPIVDDRKIIDLIPDHIKQPLLEKGLVYVRNYGEGVDMTWQDVFQTDSKEQVESYLSKTGSHFSWLDEKRLRVWSPRKVTHRHPKTNDLIWFNHAHLFHSSNLPTEVFQALSRQYSPEAFPRNAFYGDRTPIPAEHMNFIRNLYQEQALLFPWQKGDVLVLDNVLVSHGRTPFKGERNICVAMADLYVSPEYC